MVQETFRLQTRPVECICRWITAKINQKIEHFYDFNQHNTETSHFGASSLARTLWRSRFGAVVLAPGAVPAWSRFGAELNLRGKYTSK